jgi:hypothetical protein
VLDEDDGDAQPTDPAEQREQLLLLVVIEAGGRFVEQHLWLARAHERSRLGAARRKAGCAPAPCGQT